MDLPPVPPLWDPAGTGTNRSRKHYNTQQQQVSEGYSPSAQWFSSCGSSVLAEGELRAGTQTIRESLFKKSQRQKK